jgi:hypothetical protein
VKANQGAAGVDRQFLPIIVLVCGLLPLPAQAQFAQQGPKLIGTDTPPYLIGVFEQGYAVALSADGNTAVTSTAGLFYAIRVWSRVRGAWSEQQLLPGCEEAYGGTTVALSADGKTIAVGAPNVGEGYGFVCMYAQDGTEWARSGTLQVAGGYPQESPDTGTSVALSADGATVLVGVPGDVLHPSGTVTGSAWVFARSPSGWVAQRLIATDATGSPIVGAHQGASVAISADGATALVGGYSASAWVFTLTPSGWAQNATLPTSSPLALSADGNTVIGTSNNSAPLFARSSNGQWSQTATLPSAGALALSANGATAAVATSVFTRSEVGWTQQVLPAGLGEVGDADQGFSVALSADGHTALVGGPDDNNGVGAAWVYSEAVFPGVPGAPTCVGQRTAGIVRKYGGFNGAATTLGFSGVVALQDAVMAFCQQ